MFVVQYMFMGDHEAGQACCFVHGFSQSRVAACAKQNKSPSRRRTAKSRTVVCKPDRRLDLEWRRAKFIRTFIAVAQFVRHSEPNCRLLLTHSQVNETRKAHVIRKCRYCSNSLLYSVYSCHYFVFNYQSGSQYIQIWPSNIVIKIIWTLKMVKKIFPTLAVARHKYRDDWEIVFLGQAALK